MSERDEIRTADLADERRGDMMEPDPTHHEGSPETRDEPARDSWAREKLAEARDKMAHGPGETVHREDTTGWDEAPAREPDRPEATAPRTRMAPDGGSADTGGTAPATAGPLLTAEEAEAFRARWTDVQSGFVDAPREAVERADGLTAELMQHLAASFADERARLERQWDRGDDVSTDSLRGAFQRYRSFFERLLAA